MTMNFGRSIASSSMKLFISVCPAFLPDGSVTVSDAFLPERSTTRPLLSSTCSFAGVALPSRFGLDGCLRLPPSAHAMASMTLVLPWPLRPPITVRPFSVGRSATALIRLTFSSSSAEIFTGSGFA